MTFAVILGLFSTSFAAATLLPGSSEAVLIAILADGSIPLTLAVIVATLGNTLGSCVNWGLGRFSSRFHDKAWFPLKGEQFDRYQAWYAKWGIWSLFASWVPIIGDPLTVIAGFARTPLQIFTTIVLIAKLVRYLAIAGLFKLVW